MQYNPNSTKDVNVLLVCILQVIDEQKEKQCGSGVGDIVHAPPFNASNDSLDTRLLYIPVLLLYLVMACTHKRCVVARKAEKHAPE